MVTLSMLMLEYMGDILTKNEEVSTKMCSNQDSFYTNIKYVPQKEFDFVLSKNPKK